MLNYNEVRERKYIVLNDEPFEVIDSHVFRKQQRKPVNQTKLRSLITGNIRQETFHANDTIKEADISKSKIKYIFKKENRQAQTTEFWFSDIEKPSNRYHLPESVLEDKMKFIKENDEVTALLFNEDVIGIEIPLKVELKVVEAPPAVKGNTANGANKKIVLETGLVIDAPIFINEGDIVKVSTQDSSYSERVSK